MGKTIMVCVTFRHMDDLRNARKSAEGRAIENTISISLEAITLIVWAINKVSAIFPRA